jgi:hypothetical protein
MASLTRRSRSFPGGGAPGSPAPPRPRGTGSARARKAAGEPGDRQRLRPPGCRRPGAPGPAAPAARARLRPRGPAARRQSRRQAGRTPAPGPPGRAAAGPAGAAARPSGPPAPRRPASAAVPGAGRSEERVSLLSMRTGCQVVRRCHAGRPWEPFVFRFVARSTTVGADRPDPSAPILPPGFHGFHREGGVRQEAEIPDGRLPALPGRDPERRTAGHRCFLLPGDVSNTPPGHSAP